MKFVCYNYGHNSPCTLTVLDSIDVDINDLMTCYYMAKFEPAEGAAQAKGIGNTAPNNARADICPTCEHYGLQGENYVCGPCFHRPYVGYRAKTSPVA